MCVKDGNIKENEGINETAREYQERREGQVNETIQVCTQGEISPRAAQAELCRQYGKTTELQAAINKLEEARGSGITAGKVSVDRPNEGGRIMSYVDSKDNVVAFLITSNGEVVPMIPNPAYNPVVVGSQVMFNDGIGGPLHSTAQEAANAKALGEETTNPITGGDCGEGTVSIPNWVPDPDNRL